MLIKRMDEKVIADVFLDDKARVVLQVKKGKVEVTIPMDADSARQLSGALFDAYKKVFALKIQQRGEMVGNLNA